MVQTAHTDLVAYHRTQWEQTVEVFGERLARGFAWNCRLSTYYFFDELPGRRRLTPTPWGGFPLPTGFLCGEHTVERYRLSAGVPAGRLGTRYCYLRGICALDPLEAAVLRRCVPVDLNVGISTAPMTTTRLPRSRWLPSSALPRASGSSLRHKVHPGACLKARALTSKERGAGLRGSQLWRLVPIARMVDAAACREISDASWPQSARCGSIASWRRASARRPKNHNNAQNREPDGHREQTLRVSSSMARQW